VRLLLCAIHTSMDRTRRLPLGSRPFLGNLLLFRKASYGTQIPSLTALIPLHTSRKQPHALGKLIREGISYASMVQLLISEVSGSHPGHVSIPPVVKAATV
jgi:hypothetical protein